MPSTPRKVFKNWISAFKNHKPLVSQWRLRDWQLADISVVWNNAKTITGIVCTIGKVFAINITSNAAHFSGRTGHKTNWAVQKDGGMAVLHFPNYLRFHNETMFVDTHLMLQSGSVGHKTLHSWLALLYTVKAFLSLPQMHTVKQWVVWVASASNIQFIAVHFHYYQ